MDLCSVPCRSAVLVFYGELLLTLKKVAKGLETGTPFARNGLDTIGGTYLR